MHRLQHPRVASLRMNKLPHILFIHPLFIVIIYFVHFALHLISSGAIETIDIVRLRGLETARVHGQFTEIL